MGSFYALLTVVFWNVTGVHVESMAFPNRASCEDYRDTLKLAPGDYRFVSSCQLTPPART